MLEPQGITLNVTKAAIAYLAEAGFDPEFGARPVKRAIQTLLLNNLSKQIIAGKINQGQVITVDSNGITLTFSNFELS